MIVVSGELKVGRGPTGHGRLAEGVKKMEIVEIDFHKSLISEARIFCFWAFSQFFHTFGEAALLGGAAGKVARKVRKMSRGKLRRVVSEWQGMRKRDYRMSSEAALVRSRSTAP